MKRRSAKPFTVEIKKRGRRRDTEPVPIATDYALAAAELPVGRDIRFREIDTLFRSGLAESAGTAPPGNDAPAVSTSVEPERRILPDLVAEAAASEAALAAAPEQRRRGRPPKLNGHALPGPAKRRGRPPTVRPPVEILIDESVEEPASIAVPAVLFLAASARRRAARDTQNLPRGERWKRRLPKVCW